MPLHGVWSVLSVVRLPSVCCGAGARCSCTLAGARHATVQATHTHSTNVWRRGDRSHDPALSTCVHTLLSLGRAGTTFSHYVSDRAVADPVAIVSSPNKQRSSELLKIANRIHSRTLKILGNPDMQTAEKYAAIT